jgi:hypothetical protein
MLSATKHLYRSSNYPRTASPLPEAVREYSPGIS